MLLATTACNFSSLIWPAGSAPAALSSLLFDPPEPQIIGKTHCFATFLPFFSRTWIFFLLTLSLFDLLSSSLLFPDSSHLCFSPVHIVGSLTSKLPSIINPSEIRVLFTVHQSRFRTPNGIGEDPQPTTWWPVSLHASPRYGKASRASVGVSQGPPQHVEHVEHVVGLLIFCAKHVGFDPQS